MTVKCDIMVGIELPYSFEEMSVKVKLEEKLQEALSEVLDDESAKILTMDLELSDNVINLNAKIDEEQVDNLDTLAMDLEEFFAEIFEEMLEDLGDTEEGFGEIDYVEVELRN